VPSLETVTGLPDKAPDGPLQEYVAFAEPEEPVKSLLNIVQVIAGCEALATAVGGFVF
jgi:hypothetical protein